LIAGAGTYTATVTDTLCATATSAPFVVTESPQLGVAITGASTVLVGEITPLTANVSGGSGAIASYVWRNALSNVVGSGATLSTGAGTYTVEVTDTSCGTVTSAPFVVAAAAAQDVPTAGEMALLMLLCAVVMLALHRLS
jgi:hypothetical protein